MSIRVLAIWAVCDLVGSDPVACCSVLTVFYFFSTLFLHFCIFPRIFRRWFIDGFVLTFGYLPLLFSSFSVFIELEELHHGSNPYFNTKFTVCSICFFPSCNRYLHEVCEAEQFFECLLQHGRDICTSFKTTWYLEFLIPLAPVLIALVCLLVFVRRTASMLLQLTWRSIPSRCA